MDSYTVGDGSLRYRVRVRINGVQRTKVFKSEREAEKYERNARTDKDRGVALDPKLGQTLFADWWAEWTSGRANVKQTTLDTTANYYSLYISKHWDTWQLKNITKRDIQKWVTGLDKAPNTVRTAFKFFNQAMKAAHQNKFISENPCTGVKLPVVEHEELRIIGHKEIEKLSDEVPARYKALIVTLAYSGIRINEALALKWDQVDLDKGTIRVIATAVEGKPNQRPKTRNSIRTIPVPQHVRKALTEQSKAYGGHLYVFTTTNGMQISRANFADRIYRPARLAAELPKDFTIHDLRHTAISFWITAGVDVLRVMRWAGHSDAQTTLGTYGHLFDTDDTAIMQVLDNKIAAGIKKKK